MMDGVMENAAWHISLVILPVDDFTGEVIVGARINVAVEKWGRPIVKPDGFYVFTGGFGEEAVAVLWGRGYRKMRVKIRLADLDPKNPVEIIRVKPDKNHFFPKGSAFMEGILPEHSVLLVSGKTKAHVQKLRADCGEGADRITVYQEHEKNLSKALFLLADRKGDREEWAELLSPVDPVQGIYLVREPFCGAHLRMETDLFPAVKYEADELACDYFIAVYGGAGEESFPAVCCLRQNGEEKGYTFCLKAGETLRQDFC